MIPGNTANQESKRHAALALHAVSAADRSWLLDHLPRSAREDLEPLLHELTVLGIPSEPSFISRVVRSSEKPDATAELLRPENAARIADIVRSEPKRVVACLASLGEPRWRAAFIAQFPKDVCVRLMDASGGAHSTCPSRLADAILAQVRLRLNAQSTMLATQRRTWTSRVLGALRSRVA